MKKKDEPKYIIENMSHTLKTRFLGPFFSKIQDPVFSEKFEISVTIRILDSGWILERLVIDYDEVKNRPLKNSEITKIKGTLKEAYGYERSFENKEIEVIPVIPIFSRRMTEKNTYTKTINLYWGGPALNYFVVNVKDKEVLIHYFKPK